MEVASVKEELKGCFPVKVETSAVVACLFFYAFSASLAIYALSRADYALAAGVLVFLLIFSMFSWPIRYVIDDERLVWQVGIASNNTIRLLDIDRIVPARGRDGYTLGKISGHTVIAGRRKVFFSAQDQASLLNAIQEKCPHLRRYGEEWRRHLSAEGM